MGLSKNPLFSQSSDSAPTIHPSPQRDNGYDISDYMVVDPLCDILIWRDGVLVKTIRLTFVVRDMVTSIIVLDGKYECGFLPAEHNKTFLHPRSTDRLLAWWLCLAPFVRRWNIISHLWCICRSFNWFNPNVRKELFSGQLRAGQVKSRFSDLMWINLIGKDEV